jgi:hypothetical protein
MTLSRRELQKVPNSYYFKQKKRKKENNLKSMRTNGNIICLWDRVVPLGCNPCPYFYKTLRRPIAQEFLNMKN